MEVYTIPDQGLADSFLIQGTQSNPQFTGLIEQFESMYDEGSPEFGIDQGLVYPTASSYGYICTGSELTGDFEDPAVIFGFDGQDVHYTGGSNETVPVVYYTPSYGYGQSPYNPYNPYIPGAIMGMDGSYIAPQQYYTLSYDNHLSSPAYVPIVLQSGPDIIANGMTDSFVYSAESVNQVEGPEPNLFSSYPNSSQTVSGDAAARKNSFTKVAEGSRPVVGTSKQPMPITNSGGFASQGSFQVHRARGQHDAENDLSGKSPSNDSQVKISLPYANELSSSESLEIVQPSVNKIRPKLSYGRVSDDVKVSSDALGEQNKGSRTSKLKAQLVVKAYTSMAGNLDANGNITIHMDQYNRDDFLVDGHKNAMFFVIKSYSEDDVHKSIKYNVWSSTPNGNKKLNIAYEDAQRISAGNSRACSVFLFFSVNASGQFCGIAEMIGPVDFHKDMDFWQQDKWSGSFPVKWHIIKDLPNSYLRHIILENNENKSVTNSRDTQEISYKKGLEMLQIFKNFKLKTSLLDDFMYYENRQRILREERTRLLVKSHENSYVRPMVDAPRKVHPIYDIPFVGDTKVAGHDARNLALNKIKDSMDGVQKCSEQQSISVEQASVDAKVNSSVASNINKRVSADGMSKSGVELEISSLKINPKEPESNIATPSISASTTPVGEINVNVVTIGSMPVKVQGYLMKTKHKMLGMASN